MTIIREGWRRASGVGMARDLVVATLFVVGWLNLHALATVFETAPGSSAWYPARGWSLALLLLFGLRFAPVVAVASLIAGIEYYLPAHPEYWLGSTVLVTAAMAACAAWLRRRGVSAQMRLHDAVALVMACALGAFTVAAGAVAMNVRTGMLAPADYSRVVFQFFVGDFIGLLIVVPLALQLQRLWTLRRLPWAGAWRTALPETLLIIATSAAFLWLGLADADDNAAVSRGRWYLMLLPLSMAAIRFGPPGAALATLGLSLAIVAVARRQGGALALIDLQLLLLSMSVVSLLLGATVADRQRSLQALAAMHAAQARRARLEADAARRSKARFLAATTHDLRPPFEAVRLGLETLAMQSPSRSGEVLVRTTDAMRSLGRVLDNVLDIARVENELGRTMPRQFMLRPLLQQAVREAADTAGVPVRLRCADWQAVSDPVLFERVLRNLLSNAVKAVAQGGRVLVAVRRVGAVLEVSVLDSGQGIAPQQVGQVFDDFVSHRGDGMGIGLSLVREITGALGIAMRVRSQPGGGTGFRLQLPLARASLPAVGPTARAAAYLRDRVIGLAMAAPERREMLAAVLGDWGGAVVGADSMEMLEHELAQLSARSDLVITDEAIPASAAGMMHSDAADIGALLAELTTWFDVPAA